MKFLANRLPCTYLKDLHRAMREKVTKRGQVHQCHRLPQVIPEIRVVCLQGLHVACYVIRLLFQVPGSVKGPIVRTTSAAAAIMKC